MLQGFLLLQMGVDRGVSGCSGRKPALLGFGCGMAGLLLVGLVWLLGGLIEAAASCPAEALCHWTSLRGPCIERDVCQSHRKATSNSCCAAPPLYYATPRPRASREETLKRHWCVSHSSLCIDTISMHIQLHSMWLRDWWAALHGSWPAPVPDTCAALCPCSCCVVICCMDTCLLTYMAAHRGCCFLT